MPLLFSGVPVLLQLLPGLDRGVIVGVNRVGQMLVAAAAGVMAIYQEQFLSVFFSGWGQRPPSSGCWPRE